MVELTNKERLIKIEGLVINLDDNFQEFKDDCKGDNVRKWKSINKNTEAIASQKSVIRIIEGFIVGILIAIGSFFWKGNS